MSTRLSRRTVLRGVGVSMALPWLECMAPAARAAARCGAASAAGAAGGAAPVRLAFVFMPNGVNYDAWLPRGVPGAGGAGAATEWGLSPTLEPLAAVRGRVNVVTGLTLQRARANGDGPGDHARSSASFLTGEQARKTAGNDIRNGVSIDQVAAAEVGRATRLPSLELGCEHGPSSGNCDSGYSCAYSSNISWRDEATPMAKVVDPAAAFERLFGDATQAAAAQERLARRQSILDFVLDQSRALRSSLGAADTRKLDQYESSVREVERRIERARAEAAPPALPDMPAPQGVPEKISEHMDLMFDLLALAFRTDSTRVATLMLAVDGSNRAFPEIGVRDGHHHLSHHQGNAEMIEKIRRIDRFHVERFARFVAALERMPEGDGSVLENCLIMFGGGISDGNKHNHEDLPILLAGGGGRGGSGVGGAVPSLPGGRLIRTPRETPLCNLYLAMLARAGCPRERFGDSTGVLDLG